MADDWRVTIDFDDEATAPQLAEWLAAVDLEGEQRSSLGDRVIVSRDGPRVYLYADSKSRRARFSARFGADRAGGHAAVTALERWHPVEQAWKDGSVPLPTRRRSSPRSTGGSRRARPPSRRRRAPPSGRSASGSGRHEDTEALAERLESEGFRSSAGTVSPRRSGERGRRQALADRIRGEGSEGAKVEVEPGGGMVWEVAPRNPSRFSAASEASPALAAGQFARVGWSG